MKKNILIVIWICTAVLIYAATTSSAIAADVVSHEQLSDGRTFEMKYSQIFTPVTNYGDDKIHILGGKLVLRQSSNTLMKETGGRPLTNYTYKAVGYISNSGSVMSPFWTNQGAWDPSPTLHLIKGFEYYDAASDGDGIMLCYKEKHDIIVEKIPLPKNEAATATRSRQQICFDSAAGGVLITNVIFVLSNGLPVQVVATGNLPVKEISWKSDAGKWVVETLNTNELSVEDRWHLQTLLH